MVIIGMGSGVIGMEIKACRQSSSLSVLSSELAYTWQLLGDRSTGGVIETRRARCMAIALSSSG